MSKRKKKQGGKQTTGNVPSSTPKAVPDPTPAPPPPAPAHPLATFLLKHPALTGLLCGVLTAASFAGLSLFPLAWVSVAGLLLTLFFAPTTKHAVKTAFVHGLTLSALHHHWMLFVRMPSPIGWVLASGIIGGFFALWAWLTKGPGKGHPLTVVLGYLFLEHLVNMGSFSFGWYTLGYTQWNNPLVLPSVRLVGGHGLSALILAVNAGAAWWLVKRSWRPLAVAASAVVLVSLGGIAAGGMTRPLPAEVTGPLPVTMVQINVSNEEKENPTQTTEIVQAHLDGAAGEPLAPGSLVVFPETFVAAYIEDHPYFAPQWQSLQAFVRRHRVWLLFGLNDLDLVDGQQEDRNSVFLMDPQGKVVRKYNKRNLVPFGEYIPYRSLWEKLGIGTWLKENVFPVDNLPGDEPVVFEGPGGRRFATPICFETAFPWQFRQYAAMGAHFILTPTNDAWFGKSFLAIQHMSQGVVRAVESGLPVIQSSNSGISYQAGPSGALVWRTGVMESRVLRFNLTLSGPMAPRDTPYNHLGSFLEWCILLFAPISLAISAGRRTTIRP